MPKRTSKARNAQGPDALLLRKLDEWPFPEEIANTPPGRLIKHGPAVLTKLVSLLAIDDERREIRQAEVVRVIRWAMDDTFPEDPERNSKTVTDFAECLILAGWETIVEELLVPYLEYDTTFMTGEEEDAAVRRAKKILKVVLALLKEVPSFKTPRVLDLFKSAKGRFSQIVTTLSKCWERSTIGGLALQVYNQIIQSIPSPCVLAMGLMSESLKDGLVWLTLGSDTPYENRKLAVLILSRKPMTEYIVGREPMDDTPCEDLWSQALPYLEMDSCDKRGELVLAMIQEPFIRNKLIDEMHRDAILWVTLEMTKTDEKIGDILDALMALDVCNGGIELLDILLSAGALPKLAWFVNWEHDIPESARAVSQALTIISELVYMYKGNISRPKQAGLSVRVLESCDGFMSTLEELVAPDPSNEFFTVAVTLLGHMGRLGASERTINIAYYQLQDILDYGIDDVNFMNLMTFVVKKFGDDDGVWRALKSQWKRRLVKVMKDVDVPMRLRHEAALCLFKTGHFESQRADMPYISQIVTEYVATRRESTVDKTYKPILEDIVGSMIIPTTRQRRGREEEEEVPLRKSARLARA